jgi:hypothetical protein
MRKRPTEQDKLQGREAFEAAAAQRAWKRTQNAYQQRVSAQAMRPNRHRGRG